jgi:hypothetical protein
MSGIRNLIAVPFAMLLVALPARAFSPVEVDDMWEIPRKGAPSQLKWESRRVPGIGPGALGAGAAPAGLAEFVQRHGGAWHYQMNSATGTLHQVYGSGIDLPEYVDSPQAGETLARRFIRENRALFSAGAGDLRVLSNASGLGKRSVVFQQTYDGLTVWGGRAHLVFTLSGRVFAFGSDVYPDIPISTVPAIPEEEALAIAESDIGFGGESDRAISWGLMVLPAETGEGELEYHLAYRFDLRMREPFGIWATWVDANSGEILWRENHVRFLNIVGNAQGDVEWNGYCDGYTYDHPLGNMRFTIAGVGIYYTDQNGEFDIPYGGSGFKAISAGLDGRWVNVDRQGGDDASVSGVILPGSPYAIDWDSSNSLDSERDVFAFVNKEHDWVKGLDPDWPSLDYEMTATVERTDFYCPGNAWWDGEGINLCVQTTEYGNTGRMGDVVFHEYGHGITDFLYGPVDPPSDLDEGNSDVAANFLTRESMIGVGYYLDDCWSGIRNASNDMQYPCTGGGHYCGQVISGFYWDAWQDSRKLGLPQTQPDQVYWTFVADDNDGNLNNGTPHHTYFCAAASNHNFSCPAITEGVEIVHEPLGDTPDTAGAYAVTALITSTEGAIDAAACRVYFRVNGGAFADSGMTATGGADEYVGHIPAQPACTGVEYYIYAQDVMGNSNRHPAGAPGYLHSFLIGYDVVYSDDFESDLGWTAGITGDDATTGMWERCNPEATEAQTESDHTADPARYAYITGCPAGSGQGSYDVDGGTTTLESPVFDLAAYEEAKAIYYRWYSNDTGAEPGTDYWVVLVTNDGWATYEEIENTNESDRSWRRVELNLEDHIDLTDQVQFRFIASDEDPGSVVEAGVDDFLILACGEPGDTTAPDVALEMPNGGEEIPAGCDTGTPVVWTSSDDEGVTETVILFSTDSGETYPDTVDSGPLTSPYQWFPPDTSETHCRIKIVCLDAARNEGSDESDADFTMISLSGVPDRPGSPNKVVLMQNRPSPFGTSTVIEFGLPDAAEISLEIYDVAGRLVTSLANGAFEAGYHKVTWDGCGADGVRVSPGLYFYRLVTGSAALNRKLLVIQ